jgi:hypothetical protein
MKPPKFAYYEAGQFLRIEQNWENGILRGLEGVAKKMFPVLFTIILLTHSQMYFTDRPRILRRK